MLRPALRYRRVHASKVLSFLTFLCALLAVSQAQAQQGVIQRGDGVVTGFSGGKYPKDPLPPDVHALDRKTIDLDGVTVRILDLSQLTAVPNGSLVDVPTRLSFKARDIGHVFGIAFDDDQPAREKEVCLGSVEKTAQKRVIVRLKFRHALGQRKHLIPEHHHHCIEIGPCSKLRAVRAEQNLNLLAVLPRRNRCGPALKHLHEQRLMLRVKMSFRLFQQQEGNLIGMRLQQ